MKYRITQDLGASKSEIIEANSLEDALDEIDYGASLCHQCCDEVELGEGTGVIVYDEDDNEVFNDTYAENLHLKYKELKEQTDKITYICGLSKRHDIGSTEALIEIEQILAGKE